MWARDKGKLTKLWFMNLNRGAMRLCVCDNSALELLRSSGRLLPKLLERPRTGSLADCGLIARPFFDDLLLHSGVRSRPVHVMLANEAGGRRRSDIIVHRRAGRHPRRSFIAVSDDLLVTGPEFLFCDLASRNDLDVVDLAILGFEMCGTYVLDDSWDGLTNTAESMTSVAKIGRMLSGRAGYSGIAKAREALSLVRDGSNSPMETVLCALLTFPRRLGGYALGPVSLNHHVVTDGGSRFVDVAFPEAGVGLEYKGREFHSLEQVGRDDRRQNKLVGTGMTIINVWYEDLVQEHLFKQLVADLARAMGVRIRIRSESFESRQRLLRMRLLQSIRGCGDGPAASE